MKRKVLMALMCLSVLMLTSCRSKRDFLYLQDVVAGQPYPFKYHEPTVHAGDKLSITVSAKNPELALPFNSNGGVIQMSSAGKMIESAVQNRSTAYRVDQDGNSEFPLLGTLHVEGLTTNGVQELVKNRIIEGKYINNPLVNMEFLNFKYTMIGATSTGEYSSDDGRVTIIDAIAKAGDLAVNANTKKVKLFRQESGTLVMHEIDLTNSDFLQSDCYFLQQNDIVYVEPKYKKSDFGDKAFRFATFTLSVASVVASFLWVLRAYN